MLKMTQEDRRETSLVTRLAAVIVFMLAVATGYVVAPQVHGATTLADEEAVEQYDASCGGGGLVLAYCDLDF